MLFHNYLQTTKLWRLKAPNLNACHYRTSICINRKYNPDPHYLAKHLIKIPNTENQAPSSEGGHNWPEHLWWPFWFSNTDESHQETISLAVCVSESYYECLLQGSPDPEPKGLVFTAAKQCNNSHAFRIRPYNKTYGTEWDNALVQRVFWYSIISVSVVLQSH
jgi:hypothetical protein